MGLLERTAEGIDRVSCVPVGVLLILLVLLRLGAGLAFPAGETSTYEFGPIARNIVEGRGLVYFPATETEVLSYPFERVAEATQWLPSAFMPPLFPLAVAGATLVGGQSQTGVVWAVRVLNLFLACGTAWLLFLLTRRLWKSKKAATLTVLGFAVYPTTVYMATQVSASNLYIPVQVGVLVVLLAAARRPSRLLWASAGLAVGVLCLLRAETVALIPLIAAWLWWASEGRTVLLRPLLVGLFLLTAIAPPASWMVRNSIVFGRPTLAIASTFGGNLWRGNHPGASGARERQPLTDEMRAQIEALPPTTDYELRLDAVYREAAIESIKRDPVGTILRDMKKLGFLLTADFTDLRSRNPFYLAGWTLLLVLGSLGLVKWWRREEDPRDRPQRWLIAGFLAVSAAIPVVFFVLARFKLPIEVLLLVFAGGWLASASQSGHRTKN